MFRRTAIGTAALALALVGGRWAVASPVVYQTPEAFLETYLPGCRTQALWLDAEKKGEIERLLERRWPGARVRFCAHGDKTAWILDEIGKVEPITTGVVVDHGEVERVRVLIYRESRGGEVRRDAFTSQFDRAVLEDGNTLDRDIDGITGATLSVRALSLQVRLALLLDRFARGTALAG